MGTLRLGAAIITKLPDISYYPLQNEEMSRWTERISISLGTGWVRRVLSRDPPARTLSCVLRLQIKAKGGNEEEKPKSPPCPPVGVVFSPAAVAVQMELRWVTAAQWVFSHLFTLVSGSSPPRVCPRPLARRAGGGGIYTALCF